MKDLREPTGYLNKLARAFMDSQVLFVANDARVFAHLETRHSAAEVAEAVGWDARAARMLLDGLVALELVTKSDGYYHNAPIASACLVPGRPGFQGNIIRHIEHSMAGWLRLAEAVQTGKGAPERQGNRSSDELRDFILGMSDIAKMSAQEMLEVLDTDLSPRGRLLDVGAGPATYAITFLEAYPNMMATVFDLPDVIAIAREQVRTANLDRRISFIAGDLLTDSLGSGYDVVLISNIIHSFSPEKNHNVIRKCFDALEPGGLLIVKDFLTDNDRGGPAYSLMFALHMLVGTGEGDTYSFAEVEAWTRDAGFEDGRIVDLTPQTRLWLVKKPFPKYRSPLLGILDKTPPRGVPREDVTPE